MPVLVESRKYQNRRGRQKVLHIGWVTVDPPPTPKIQRHKIRAPSGFELGNLRGDITNSEKPVEIFLQVSPAPISMLRSATTWGHDFWTKSRMDSLAQLASASFSDVRATIPPGLAAQIEHSKSLRQFKTTRFHIKFTYFRSETI